MSLNLAVQHQPEKIHSDLPVSFEKAIEGGWKIVSEPSALQGKQRTGTVVLGITGRSERLKIEYIATPRGYSFREPKVIR